MNRNLFCILYSEIKGAWIVVRESALARGALRYAGCVPMLLARSLIAAEMVSLVAGPILQAQVVVRADNGTPVVQIAPPVGGLSRNAFQAFNVGREGLVFNNAPVGAETQLAGTVPANPHLQATGAAAVILTQVTGTGPSELNGFMEVAGSRADLIIANPNGIVCNGGGLINVGRGVVTTGVPLFSDPGGLEGFQITGGSLTIGRDGWDARGVDQLDLLTRSLAVHGPIKAGGDLNVIIGANRVAFEGLGVTTLPDPDGKPAVGVDVARMGGMYARRIHLVGTETGVGVNSQGTLSARNGGFTCTQAGRIVLAGPTTSLGDLTVAGEAITSPGQIRSRGDAALTATAGDIDHRGGRLQARGTFTAHARGAFRNDSFGQVQARRVSIEANGIANQDGGQIRQTGNDRMSLTSSWIDNRDGQIQSRGSATLTATQDIRNSGGGSIHADGLLRLRGRNLFNDSGWIASSVGGLSLLAEDRLINIPGTAGPADGGVICTQGQAHLQAGRLENGGQILGGAYLSLNADALANRHLIKASGQLDLEAGSLTNTHGELSAASMALAVRDLDNSAGLLHAQAIQVDAATLSNTGGILIQDGPAPMTLKVAKALTNTQGGMIGSAAADLRLAPGRLDNQGGIILHTGEGTLALAPGQGRGDLEGQDGTIVTQGRLDLRAGNVDNRGGTMEGHRGVALTAQTVRNDGGHIASQGDRPLAVVATGAISNVGGSLGGNGKVEVHAAVVDNARGTMHAGTALSVAAAGDLSNPGGALHSNGDLTVEAEATLTNTGGWIEAGGSGRAGATLRVDAVALDNTGGRIANAGDGDSRVSGTETIRNGNPGGKPGLGTIRAAGRLTARAPELTNTRGGNLYAGGDLALEVDRSLVNRGGQVHARQHLTMERQGATLANDGGQLSADAGVDLQVARLDNAGGVVGTPAQSSGPVRITTKEPVSNLGGSIRSGGNLSLDAPGVSQDGLVMAGQDATMAVQGDYTLPPGSRLSAQRNMTLTTTGRFTNEGHLTVPGVLAVKAAEVDNPGRISGREVTLDAEGFLDNRTGMVDARERLRVTATDLRNGGGTLVVRSGIPEVEAPDLRTETKGAAPVAQTKRAPMAREAKAGPGPVDAHEPGLTIQVHNLDNAEGLLRNLGPQNSILTAHNRLTNADGLLEGLGRLTLVTEGLLDNQRGRITAGSPGSDATTLTVSAAAIDNREGWIAASGGEGSRAGITTPGPVDNAQGTLGSGGNLTLRTETLAGAGHVAVGQDLELTFSGDTHHPAGSRIEAGRDLILETKGAWSHEGHLQIPGQLTVQAAEARNQTHGRIQAAAARIESVRSLLNEGRISAGTVHLQASAGGLTNHGQVEALDATLQSGTITNGQGAAVQASRHLTVQDATAVENAGTLAAGATLRAHVEVMRNAGGTLAAGRLDLKAATLDNRGGKAEAKEFSGTFTTVQNQRGTLTHTGEGPMTLAVSEALRNGLGGQIQSNGDLTLAPRTLVNASGRILHAGGGRLAIRVQDEIGLNNQEGTIQTNGDLTLEAGRIDNRGGSLTAQGRAALTTTTGGVDNSARMNGQGEARNGLVSADHLVVQAPGQTLINRGDLQATRGLTLEAGVLDNEGGRIAGGAGTVSLAAPRFNNRNGQVRAGQDLHATLAAVPAEGTVTYGRDAAFVLSGDHVQAQGTTLAAPGNLTLGIRGRLTNAGTLEAGATLTIQADQVENQATGLINGVTTRVTAAGAMQNRGRVYGTEVGLGAATFTNGKPMEDRNRVEGPSRQPTTEPRGWAAALQTLALQVSERLTREPQAWVAARQSLRINAPRVINHGRGAVLFSERDLTIESAPGGAASPSGSFLENISGTIQAFDGDLTIRTGEVGNRNPDFVAVQKRLSSRRVNLYTPLNWPFAMLGRTFEESELTPAPRGKLNAPGCFYTEPLRDLLNNHRGHTTGDEVGGCYFVVTPDARAHIHIYNKHEVTREVTETSVVRTFPGQLLAGRDLAFAASRILNDKSRIIAGRNLTGTAGSLTNLNHPAKRLTRDTGTTHFSREEDRVVQQQIDMQKKRYLESLPKLQEKYARLLKRHGANELKRRGIEPPSLVPSRKGTPGEGGGMVPIQDCKYKRKPYEATTEQTFTLTVAVDASHQPREARAVAPASGASPSMALTSRTTGHAEADAGIGPLSAGDQMTLRPPQVPPLAQTVGTAMVPIPSLQVTEGGLHRLDLATGAASLVATDPAFLRGQTTRGMEHLLDRLPLDPEIPRQRLGDGHYEQHLVSQQVLELVGRPRLTPGASTAGADFLALMDSGLAQHQELHLKPGAALTEAQQAGLRRSILWPVVQQVALPGHGQAQVLVPVVYLDRATAERKRVLDSAVIAAENMGVTLDGRLEQSGTLLAERQMAVTAADIHNSGRVRTTAEGSSLALFSLGDFLHEGLIQGGAVEVKAAGNLTLASSTRDTSSQLGNRTYVDSVARLEADSLVAVAGRDLNLVAARVSTRGNAALKANRALNLGALATRFDETHDGDRIGLVQQETNVVGSQVAIGGSLVMDAGTDLKATAASVTAEGKLSAHAGGDLSLTPGQATSDRRWWAVTTSEGLLSTRTEENRWAREARTAIGSLFAAREVDLKAGRKLLLEGSGVAAIGDVSLVGVGKVEFKAATHSERISTYNRVQESGLLSSGGIGFGLGSREEKHQYDTSQTVQSRARTQVGSLQGNLTIRSAGAIQDSGSHLACHGNMEIKGHRVRLDPGQDEHRHWERHEISQTGLSVALTSGAVGQAQAFIGHAEGLAETQGNALLTAIHAMSLQNQHRNLRDRERKAARAQNAGEVAQAAGLQFSATLGASRSVSESSSWTRSQAGTEGTAGGNLTIITTGGDLDARGSVFTATNATLRAQRRMNLTSAENVSSNHSSSSSSSASIGVTMAVGPQPGFSLDLAVAASRGSGNGSSITHQDFQLVVPGTLTVASGSDTTLAGAQLEGGTGVVEIGGDLTVQSRQGSFRQESSQTSTGVTVGIPLAPRTRNTIGFNHSNARATGDSLAVDRPTGISIGEGGLRARVAGHTDLQGGTLGSTATPDRNHLTTGTISHSDLRNHSRGSADAFGIGLDSSLLPDRGAGQTRQQRREQRTQALVSSASTLLTAQAGAGSSDASITRSQVAMGTVTITDEAGQLARTGQTAAQAVASLHRQPQGAHRPLARPDVEGLRRDAETGQRTQQQLGAMLAPQVAAEIEAARTRTEPSSTHAAVEGPRRTPRSEPTAMPTPVEPPPGTAAPVRSAEPVPAGMPDGHGSPAIPLDQTPGAPGSPAGPGDPGRMTAPAPADTPPDRPGPEPVPPGGPQQAVAGGAASSPAGSVASPLVLVLPPLRSDDEPSMPTATPAQGSVPDLGQSGASGVPAGQPLEQPGFFSAPEAPQKPFSGSSGTVSAGAPGLGLMPSGCATGVGQGLGALGDGAESNAHHDGMSTGHAQGSGAGSSMAPGQAAVDLGWFISQAPQESKYPTAASDPGWKSKQPAGRSREDESGNQSHHGAGAGAGAGGAEGPASGRSQESKGQTATRRSNGTDRRTEDRSQEHKTVRSSGHPDGSGAPVGAGDARPRTSQAGGGMEQFGQSDPSVQKPQAKTISCTRTSYPDPSARRIPIVRSEDGSYHFDIGPIPGVAAPAPRDETKNDTSEKQPAGGGWTAGKGAATSIGSQASNDAMARTRYHEMTRDLKGAPKGDPAASAARTAAKQLARAESTPAGAAIAETMRPMAQEAARVGGSAGSTNTTVDAAMRISGKAGPALLAAGVAVSVYNVATAPEGEGFRAAAGESGALAGAIAFGTAGAQSGAVVGAAVGALFGGVGAVPGAAIGAILGGAGGGMVGASAGQEAATFVYDAVNDPKGQ